VPRRSIPLVLALALGAPAALAPAASAQPGADSPIFINLAGYSLALYNGSGGAIYDTDALSGIVGASRTVTLTYPSNGIQYGAPDGVALVGPGNVVVQFLSYEGTFTAVSGPASGITSTDIGESEKGSEERGLSLQLSGSGGSYGDFTWQAAGASSFGALNAGQSYSTAGPGGGGDPPPPPPPSCADTIAEVQGPGDATPCSGQVVTVEGVVTGDFQGASNLNGVFVQGRPATATRPPPRGSSSSTRAVRISPWATAFASPAPRRSSTASPSSPWSPRARRWSQASRCRPPRRSTSPPRPPPASGWRACGSSLPRRSR